MGEGREEQKGIETRSKTYSSHLKDHLNESVPVYFSSTVLVGLQSSRNLILLDAEGAVAVCATLG